MAGGTGNDTYIVDSVDDFISEGAGAGTDRVNAFVSDTLDANVENLILLARPINGTGNSLDNVINGNAYANSLFGLEGNDSLNGGTGNDFMAGGTGNDTYVVDIVGDVVSEAAGEGTDRVNASVSDTLDANVENLYLYRRGDKRDRQQPQQYDRRQRPRQLAFRTRRQRHPLRECRQRHPEWRRRQ